MKIKCVIIFFIIYSSSLDSSLSSFSSSLGSQSSSESAMLSLRVSAFMLMPRVGRAAMGGVALGAGSALTLLFGGRIGTLTSIAPLVRPLLASSSSAIWRSSCRLARAMLSFCFTTSCFFSNAISSQYWSGGE